MDDAELNLGVGPSRSDRIRETLEPVTAVPTAGLPEQVGGSRNWDYRRTWIRDGAFSVFALLGLGFTEEATAFGEWLRARVDERAGEGSGPLKIMHRIDGSSELTEETLDHLDGYMGSRPVRIGNGASDQLQLDIYGEAMNSIHASTAVRCVIGASDTRAGSTSSPSSTGCSTGTIPTRASGRRGAAGATSSTGS